LDHPIHRYFRKWNQSSWGNVCMHVL